MWGAQIADVGVSSSPANYVEFGSHPGEMTSPAGRFPREVSSALSKRSRRTDPLSLNLPISILPVIRISILIVIFLKSLEVISEVISLVILVATLMVIFL